MKVVDPNMAMAYGWAKEIGKTPPLPKSLEDVNQRAKLVDTVDGCLVRNTLLNKLNNKEKNKRLEEVAKKPKNTSEKSMRKIEKISHCAFGQDV